MNDTSTDEYQYFSYETSDGSRDENPMVKIILAISLCLAVLFAFYFSMVFLVFRRAQNDHPGTQNEDHPAYQPNLEEGDEEANNEKSLSQTEKVEQIQDLVNTMTWSDLIKLKRSGRSKSLSLDDETLSNIPPSIRKTETRMSTKTEHQESSSNFLVTNLQSLCKLTKTVSSSFASVNTTNTSKECCAICLSSFQSPDVVCQSKNQACCHTFHQVCLAEWLAVHEDCPVCRRPYLAVSKKDDEEQSTGTDDSSEVDTLEV
mmetsp:Transcript_37641/g.78104  ORF Transcript_37641/g.78104 Transcript_37641/m.78104 type:complete len:260 (+) Transcript_37641:266-1045(+)